MWLILEVKYVCVFILFCYHPTKAFDKIKSQENSCLAIHPPEYQKLLISLQHLEQEMFSKEITVISFEMCPIELIPQGDEDLICWCLYCCTGNNR